MAIDEVKFGELIGTVGALVTVVADMKGAIIPALKEQRQEMANHREETRIEMQRHKEEDAAMHTLVTNIVDWKEGTPDQPGARKKLNDLVEGKVKLVAFMCGITIMGGLLGHKAADGVTFLLTLLHG